ncbi:MAG: gluconate 2-dehydrogenase subunit 3 family protein, partial [Acidobacteria bacterium]|nr:gluconate 2-dehydrogenase subunit 3 family protein [Acidobacteriota bacterium]
MRRGYGTMADRAKRQASCQGTLRHPEAAISRRKFIQGAVAVSAAGMAALPARARGATPPTPGRDAADPAGAGEDAGTYRVLTPEEGRALAAVLNRIIPATDVMPGAGDVGVARFIDGVLVDAPHLRPRITSLLHAADAGERFTNLREPERDSRLREMARREKESFDTLLRAAYTGYYSEPLVLA